MTFLNLHLCLKSAILSIFTGIAGHFDYFLLFGLVVFYVGKKAIAEFLSWGSKVG
jgi:hypothetical protein